MRCERCNSHLDGQEVATVEAFELSGAWLCDDCAEEVFEEGTDDE